ncbi:unnamed protein product [Didymodactylos carnosus]|uniref:V-SNARE coiled-coil homology domain-containing protein n=1 Tax=Didymodactylos carnosus TaxID=1234261 RepID=A0A813QD90_9BILA|nr:unnamed protein product [Didymodactylos carnosus]CAF1190106.1 unnamed protein product [Didymodactylos carnosus]CAF3547490.1 unnamed protein product [Didymodactylos carnosus]CAF4001158.1 unnamed protein product [Didymodactylos carnosus]
MSTDEPSSTTNNLNNLRTAVRDTTSVLHTTVDKLVQRGDHLENLDKRAETFSQSAYQFHGRARQIRQRMRWENYKITIIIVCVVAVIITVIIILSVQPWKKK